MPVAKHHQYLDEFDEWSNLASEDPNAFEIMRRELRDSGKK